MLSHMWLSFSPVKPFAIKELMTSCCLLQEKKRKAVMDGVSMLLSAVSPDCFGWVPVSFPGTAVAVSECFILPYWQTYCRLCSFTSAFLQGLDVLPLQHCWVPPRPSAWQRCTAPRWSVILNHLTESVSALPCQAFYPVWLLHLPKGLSNKNLLMLWFFPASAYSSVRNFWKSGWLPKVSEVGHSYPRCSITNMSQGQWSGAEKEMYFMPLNQGMAEVEAQMVALRKDSWLSPFTGLFLTVVTKQYQQ